MIVKTGRFGELKVAESEVIRIERGIIGFSEYQNFVVVDPGDETLIVWLQSLDRPDMAFPLLEPKVYKPDYRVKLSAADQRELELEKIGAHAAVFGILTIPPHDITKMSANLKAPLVINLKSQKAKQVVLQENEYGIHFEMFTALKSHIMTIQSQQKQDQSNSLEETSSSPLAIELNQLTPFEGIELLA